MAVPRGSEVWTDTLVCELETIGRAWDLARRRALDRLTEEARQVEADAVVGVRLSRGEHDWTRGSVDYVLSGTAVRLPGAGHAAWPVLTDLSSQDYWRLHEAGYATVGLVATTAVIFVSTARSTRWRRTMRMAQNQELPEITKAVFAARDAARARLLGQARDHHADGIVGMKFEQQVRREEFNVESPIKRKPATPLYTRGASEQERQGMVITFHGTGTAIRRVARVEAYPPETVIGAVARA